MYSFFFLSIFKSNNHYDILCLISYQKMEPVLVSVMGQSIVPHCRPSDQEEIQKFMYLPEECMQSLRSMNDDNESFEQFKFH